MSTRASRSLGLILAAGLLSAAACASPTAFAPGVGVCVSIENAAIAKSAGCDYVEEGVRSFLVPDRPDLEFQAEFALLKGSPLPVRACNSFLPEALKSVGPEARHDEIIAFAETAFRRAREAGIRHVVFGSSGSRGIPDGFDRAAARGQFVGLLRRLGPVAGKYGIVVALEPLRRAECNFVNTVTEGAAIVREVDDPHVRLLADFYHMLCEDEGPGSIVAAGPLLVHCHIAEEEGRTPPGFHGQDFTPYLEALRRIGYAGGISFEGRFSDLAKELPVAVTTLRAQIAKVSAAAGTK